MWSRTKEVAMKRLLLIGVLAVALLLALSVPALAAEPTTKDVGSFQAQEATVGLADDFSGFLLATQWNANIPGVDTSEGGLAWCYFEDSAEGIVIQAGDPTVPIPMAPNQFSFGKNMNNAKLTIPAVFTYDSHDYSGTVEVRWEGVGDIGSEPASWSTRSPEPPGPWSLLEKVRISLEYRFADVTVTVKCPDLDYEKTVTAPSPQGYMGWLFAQHVYLEK